MPAHKFVPGMFDKTACYHCKEVFDHPNHAESRYKATERIPVPPSEPMKQRIAAMEQETKEVLEEQKRRNQDRIERARRIATILWNQTNQPVMVWQVQDYWTEKFEHMISWKDEQGKTYWAGAIFTKKEWKCVGMGKSPYNHNDSNKKWVPITST